MIISYILAEIFTPAWKRDVRQITYQFVEAMREAQKRIRARINFLFFRERSHATLTLDKFSESEHS